MSKEGAMNGILDFYDEHEFVNTFNDDSVWQIF